MTSFRSFLAFAPLFISAVLLGFFADMLRKAWRVRADSLLLPIAALVLVFLVLVIKHTRLQLRRLRRKNVDFVRPRRPRWDDIR